LAFGFVHVKVAAISCGNTSGVLSAVLQQQQGVIDLLIDRFSRDNTDDATH
jgi:hypothetical protein